MTKLSLNKGAALIVVAHPDDETIWMGGTILKFSAKGGENINWTIFSLCRGDDPDRAPKFRKACKFYGARAVMSDLEDEGIMNVRESTPEIEKRIKQEIGRKRFTYLFTHRYNGEYGHPRHKGANRAVKNLIAENQLRADRVFSFGYTVPPGNDLPLPDENADYEVRLDNAVFNQKKNLIEKIYGFNKDSFEYRSAGFRETFCDL